MSIKSILFNTDMVRAILAGRKTVTRRVVNPQPEGAHTILDCDEGEHTFDLLCGNGGVGGFFADWAETIKAPFWPGDILYVRETWTQDGDVYRYKAGFYDQNRKWRPSIHMPREAARIFLRVTDVRVERLQEMTVEDLVRDFDFCREAIQAVGRDVLAKPLWDSAIKPADRALYGWGVNPWVWVIEFERCEKPKGD